MADPPPLVGDEVILTNPARNSVTTRQIATLAQTNPTITGGTIDNTVIGGTTPAAGTFTALASIGNTTAGGFFIRSVGAALAAAGTTRADALALTKEVNYLSTVASGTGVVLPAAVAGMRVTIFNAGASVAQVYAPGSVTIDGVAGATGVPLTNTKRADFFCLTTTAWVSAQLGVVSA